jgi:hypothetical protein
VGGKGSTVIYIHIISFLLFLYGGVSFAQLGGAAEKSAMKLMERHRWQKVEAKLRKTLAKDTLNPSVRYLISVFYFDADNPGYNLDSAYHYAVGALNDYALTPARDRDKLRRINVDSLRLTALRASIDSTAFDEARKANTEAAYLKFLSEFPSAVQRDLAAQLRDEVAYQDAVRESTHQAFLSYLTRYPGSHRAAEARVHYDRLLYTAETKDQRLASFERFLKEHPETPYRKEIYRHIFEISTADGSVESFLAFITRYPVSDLVKKAGQMIFHILAEEEDPEWPGQFLNDSLRNLLMVNRNYLVPVMKNNLYGFIDQNGREVIPPAYKTIHPDYLCGHIDHEVLILDHKLFARNGSVIYNGPVTGLTDLGAGFLKVNTGKDIKVVHKGGFVFQDSVEDCRVLSRSYIAVKKNDAWLLYTLTGRLLDETKWDDIAVVRDVIAFKRNKKLYIALKEQLARGADGIPLRLSEPFDEIKPWPQGLLWGKAGDFQGVLNQGLHSVIRFDKHRVTQTFFGALAQKPNGYTLYNWTGKKSSTFDRVNIFDPWVTVKKSRSWYLFDPVIMKNQTKAYDTIRAEGPFLVGQVTDTVYVHFAHSHVAAFFRPQKVSFIPGMDSTSFLLVEESPKGKSVFDRRGQKLFSFSFDAIEYAGQGIFAVTRREKKGLINMRGETLLPPEYDAIGSVNEQVVSLLKNKKFGAFHISHKKLIKPQYDRNILPYTANLISTFKNGFYGFLGWDNKPASHFDFDEIRYWDDSTALVRKGTFWNFYEIYAQKNTESNLRNIIMVRDAQDEKIAIIQKENNYGVVSNRRNVIIPVTFSDIVNLGSAERPLYFTEKHIREASLFVVIYYDEAGNMLRKEIYDEAADYDKIYCSDN